MNLLITLSFFFGISQVNFPPPDPKNCTYDTQLEAYHCYNPASNSQYYYYADGTFFYPGGGHHYWGWNDRSTRWWGMGTDGSHFEYPNYPYEHNVYYYHSYAHRDPYYPTHEYGWWYNGKTWQWGLGHSGHHVRHKGRHFRDYQKQHY